MHQQAQQECALRSSFAKHWKPISIKRSSLSVLLLLSSCICSTQGAPAEASSYRTDPLLDEYRCPDDIDLWGVTAYMNPTGCRNMLTNFRRFRRLSRPQCLRLVTVELVFGDSPFELQGNDTDLLVQLRTAPQNVMLSRERLLNIAVGRLPKHVRKVAWLEANVLFTNPNWVFEASRLLGSGRYAAVQVFAYQVRHTWGVTAREPDTLLMVAEPGWGEGFVVQSAALGKSVKKGADSGIGIKTGSGWAVRREVLDKLGLYDRCVLGCGDAALFAAITGTEPALPPYHTDADYSEWARKFREAVQPLGFVDGFVVNMVHQDLGNQEVCNDILASKKFDASKDIKLATDGTWYWTNGNNSMASAVADFLVCQITEIVAPPQLVPDLAAKLQRLPLRCEDTQQGMKQAGACDVVRQTWEAYRQRMWPVLLQHAEKYSETWNYQVGFPKLPPAGQVLWQVAALPAGTGQAPSYGPQQVILPRVTQLNGTTWGITVYLNPARSRIKLSHFQTMSTHSRAQGLQLLVVELAFGDDPFEVPSTMVDEVVQMRTDRQHMMPGQKERLLNVALKRLPKSCDKVVWIDSDVLLTNSDWLAQTAQLLETFPVVQPYAYAVLLPPLFKSLDPLTLLASAQHPGVLHSTGLAAGAFLVRGETMPSSLGEDAGWDAKNVPDTLCQEGVGGHPGLVWAARRSLLTTHGIFDRHVLGSEDLMAAALLGCSVPRLLPQVSRDAYAEWAAAVFKDVRGRVGYTHGFAFRLWHPSQSLRAPHEDPTLQGLHKLVLEEKLSSSDVKEGVNGELQWTGDKPRLQKTLQGLYKPRQEELDTTQLAKLYQPLSRCNRTEATGILRCDQAASLWKAYRGVVLAQHVHVAQSYSPPSQWSVLADPEGLDTANDNPGLEREDQVVGFDEEDEGVDEEMMRYVSRRTLEAEMEEYVAEEQREMELEEAILQSAEYYESLDAYKDDSEEFYEAHYSEMSEADLFYEATPEGGDAAPGDAQDSTSSESKAAAEGGEGTNKTVPDAGAIKGGALSNSTGADKEARNGVSGNSTAAAKDAKGDAAGNSTGKVKGAGVAAPGNSTTPGNVTQGSAPGNSTNSTAPGGAAKASGSRDGAQQKAGKGAGAGGVGDAGGVAAGLKLGPSDALKAKLAAGGKLGKDDGADAAKDTSAGSVRVATKRASGDDTLGVPDMVRVAMRLQQAVDQPGLNGAVSGSGTDAVVVPEKLVPTYGGRGGPAAANVIARKDAASKAAAAAADSALLYVAGQAMATADMLAREAAGEAAAEHAREAVAHEVVDAADAHFQVPSVSNRRRQVLAAEEPPVAAAGKALHSPSPGTARMVAALVLVALLVVGLVVGILLNRQPGRMLDNVTKLASHVRGGFMRGSSDPDVAISLKASGTKLRSADAYYSSLECGRMDDTANLKLRTNSSNSFGMKRHNMPYIPN